MFDEIFLLILSGSMALLFFWAFRTLPQEDWQIFACLPVRKGPGEIWSGVNITYYGFFTAMAYVFAVLLFWLMMGALSVKIIGVLAVVLPVLIICMWSARFIARWVEGKRNTFSVGAASFVGIIIAPMVIVLVDATLGQWWSFHLPVTETMAAMLIAYAFGEGMGRLACISFGCCYGKKLDDCHPLIKKIFRRRHFVFRGKTKKIAYAGHLDGLAVIPVQAITATIYTTAGIVGFYLFLKGFAAAALIGVLIVTQIWRFASEFLRADYRGAGIFSAYQFMALITIFYTLMILFLVSETNMMMPSLANGLESLWHPGMIVFLALLWIVVLFYTGRSEVTCSSITIKIVDKNI